MEYFSPSGAHARWSRIALGCWQLAPSDGWKNAPSAAEAEATVRRALEEGITTFDTAEGYGEGESERRLSKALGRRRDQVAIISKIWPDAELTLKAYKERLDRTLANLQREYVDLYLLHFPVGLDEPEKNEKFCEIMRNLKESGKARLVGLSNFTASDLRKLGDDASVFSYNEVCYNLLEREFEGNNLAAHLRRGIGYLAYSPLAQGVLSGRFDRSAKLDDPTRKRNPLFQPPLIDRALEVVAVLEEIGEELDATPAQVAIAWTLRRPNIAVVIVGSRRPEQVSEFALADRLALRLKAEHLDRIDQASDAFQQESAPLKVS